MQPDSKFEISMKYKGLIVAAVAVIVIQLVYWLAISSVITDANSRGVFGDMFGGLTALFSGLAFAGMIYAIILQSKELALQRKELALTRSELAASRKEQEKAADAQQLLVEKQLMSAKIHGVAAIVQGRYQYASSFGTHARNVKQYAVEAEDHLVNLINECSDEQFSFTPLP